MCKQKKSTGANCYRRAVLVDHTVSVTADVTFTALNKLHVRAGAGGCRAIAPQSQCATIRTITWQPTAVAPPHLLDHFSGGVTFLLNAQTARECSDRMHSPSISAAQEGSTIFRESSGRGEQGARRGYTPRQTKCVCASHWVQEASVGVESRGTRISE